MRHADVNVSRIRKAKTISYRFLAKLTFFPVCMHSKDRRDRRQTVVVLARRCLFSFSALVVVFSLFMDTQMIVDSSGFKARGGYQKFRISSRLLC
jgi:hypothetical protein